MAATRSPKTPNRKVTNPDDNPPIYRCTKCGKRVGDAKTLFFMSKASPLYTANESYVHICCDCINELMSELKAVYNQKIAMIVICHYLDLYFDEDLYETMKDNANFGFGIYIRTLNMRQNKTKNFTSTLVGMVRKECGLKTPDEIIEFQERKWSAGDLKNKEVCIHTIGYDCFEDSNYTPDNLRSLYNTLSGYLTDEVVSDPHKVQCVIEMVKTLLQLEEVNKLITAELHGGKPNEQKLKTLGEIKARYTDIINETADGNGISAKSSGKNKLGSNSLGTIMREMEENGYEDIKVNVTNSKLSESYKEIALASTRAIFNELNFQSDEYANMVALQSQKIHEYQDKIESLEEELRLLQVKQKENGGT